MNNKTLVEVLKHLKTKGIDLIKIINDKRAIVTDGYVYSTVLFYDDFGKQRWFSPTTHIDKILNEFQFPPLK